MPAGAEPQMMAGHLRPGPLRHGLGHLGQQPAWAGQRRRWRGHHQANAAPHLRRVRRNRAGGRISHERTGAGSQGRPNDQDYCRVLDRADRRRRTGLGRANFFPATPEIKATSVFGLTPRSHQGWYMSDARRPGRHPGRGLRRKCVWAGITIAATPPSRRRVCAAPCSVPQV